MGRVNRHVNSYGYHVTPRQEWRRYRVLPNGSWIGGTPGPVEGNRSVRLNPIAGNRIGNFRLPTQWGMLATRTQTSAFAYTCITNGGIRYAVEGSGIEASHGVPKPFVGYTASASAVVVLVSSNTVNRARAEALAKIKEQYVDVGTALAESGQVVKMLAISIARLLNLYKALRRGYKYKRTSSNSSLWLEFQYGWKPLISDIYGLSEQLREGFRSRDQLFKVERTVVESLDPNEFVSPTGISKGPHFSFERTQAQEMCKVVYWQKVSSPQLLALSQLGLVNPLLIAWELVPFSFVIDWLIPIGTVLQGLTATLGTTFVSGYEDRIVSCDLAWTNTLYNFLEGKKARCEYKQYAFQRITKLTWDWAIPYWKNPFSTTHVANAIALLNETRRK